MAVGNAKGIALGLVGVGKIARDQHILALAQNSAFALVATASTVGSVDKIAAYSSVEQMIQATPTLTAVSICTPPQGRYAVAKAALSAGLHVMMEKPPGATVNEVEELKTLASKKNVALFAAWHSREAAVVDPARAWLAGKPIRAARITWKEDVRVWHPGQEWIWEPGGFGVFDPGINALSIVTKILPGAIILESAALSFPANRSAPIKADLQFSYEGHARIDAAFDFLQTGPQTWDIAVETAEGTLLLSLGGAEMRIDGAMVPLAPSSEYARLYARFADLIAAREVDADLGPLRHVADALMLGRRVEVAPFNY